MFFRSADCRLNVINYSTSTIYATTAFFVFTVVVFLGLPRVVNASITQEEDVSISIQAQEQSLSQAIEKVSKYLNLDISMRGATPKILKNISFTEVPIEQAIDRLMHLYGITNHAAIYDFEKGKLLLTILDSSPLTNTVPSSGNFKLKEKNQNKTLNQIQIAQLDKDKDIERNQMLSDSQKKSLQSKSFAFEDGMRKQDLLTPEQKIKLEKKSIDSSLLSEKGADSLNKAQINLLKQKEIRYKLEEQHESLLTSAQEAKLQKTERDVDL